MHLTSPTHTTSDARHQACNVPPKSQTDHCVPDGMVSLQNPALGTATVVPSVRSAQVRTCAVNLPPVVRDKEKELSVLQLLYPLFVDGAIYAALLLALTR